MRKLVWRVCAEQAHSALSSYCRDENAYFLTRSDFFARIRHWAFRELPDLLVDDFAPIIVATAHALENSAPSLHIAFSQVASLRLLHEGGAWAHEIHAALLAPSLLDHFSKLALIERELLSKSRLSKEASLLMALKWLRQQEQLPKMLLDVEEIIFESVVDFSECELQILFRIAELSQKIRFQLPFDPHPRGLLLSVQALLAQIEARSALLPIAIELDEIQAAPPLQSFFEAIFSDENSPKAAETSGVHVAMPSQFATQINWVCEHICAVRAQSDAPVSVALALRTFDARVRWFEEGLRRYQLPYKISASLALSELPQTKVLLRKLSEKMEGQDPEIKKSISAFLNDATAILGEDDLTSLFKCLSRELEGNRALISLQSFYNWLSALLEKREVAFASPSCADFVELVSVKQLSSQNYDYVFLVDLAQGRFPKAEQGDGLFSDADRQAINQAMGLRVLPLLFDDPLEPSALPARQAYESLWFVNALTSARKGLFLSSSGLDPGGREQAPSEFLNAAMRVAGNRKSSPFEMPSRARRGGPGDFVLPPKDKEKYQVDPTLSKKVFQRWLGLSASHPLTPTRLEAFAACPFRALVEKIFGIEDNRRSHYDIDARRIGRFAHAVLEAFFKAHESGEFEEGLSTEGRWRLSRIIEDKKELLSDGAAKTPQAIVKANILWLSLVLERAISNLLKDPPVESVHPFLFEQAVGFKDIEYSLPVGEEKLFLGGIIDRVDEGAHSYAVVDYKMSSAMALRQKLSAHEILQSHFQLPLYARLLLEAHPEAREKNLYAYLVSIRDGIASQVLGRDTVQEFKELILDDEREDGLASSIKRVMAPIMEGKFAAKRNDSCSYCHLKSVCRMRDVGIAEADHA